MASKFGGIEVDKPSKFGGIPMTPEQEALIAKPMSWTDAAKDYSPLRTAATMPQSLANNAEMLLKPIFRPDEFAGDMVPVIKGLAEKAFANVSNTFLVPQELRIKDTPKYDAVADPVKEHFKGYMDPETVKRRMEEDPYAVALDVYTLVTGAVGAKNLTSAAIKQTYSDKLPQRMLETSAKFSTTLDDAARARITKTLLREKIPISPKGLQKMVDLIGEQNALIEQVIAAHGKGVRYPRAAVLSGLKKIKESKLGKWEGGKDAAIIQKAIDSQLAEIERVGTHTMSLKELQEFKKSAYRKINWRTGTNKQTLKNEIAKSVAKEAKEGIEQIAPEVKGLNAREGDLLNALEHVTKSSGRINNNNFIGMDALVKPGAGSMVGMGFGLGPEVGAGVGAVGHVLGRPNIKGSIAQALYDYRRSLPRVPDDALIKAMTPAMINLQDKSVPK